MTKCPYCGNCLSLGNKGEMLCASGPYRYWLKADVTLPEGQQSRGTCLFIMLNPATKEDQEHSSSHGTRERCKYLAEQWGYGTLVDCNLFPKRGTPSRFVASESNESAEPDNDKHLLLAAQDADLIVCAWGGDGAINRRAYEVVQMLVGKGFSHKLHTLGFTQSNHQPRHPKPRNPQQWPKPTDLQPWSDVERWLTER